MSEDQLSNFGVKGILTNEEVDDRAIIISPTDNILTQIMYTQLNGEVPLESKPENYGINNFVKAKEIISIIHKIF